MPRTPFYIVHYADDYVRRAAESEVIWFAENWLSIVQIGALFRQQTPICKAYYTLLECARMCRQSTLSVCRWFYSALCTATGCTSVGVCLCEKMWKRRRTPARVGRHIYVQYMLQRSSAIEIEMDSPSVKRSWSWAELTPALRRCRRRRPAWESYVVWCSPCRNFRRM